MTAEKIICAVALVLAGLILVVATSKHQYSNEKSKYEKDCKVVAYIKYPSSVGYLCNDGITYFVPR